MSSDENIANKVRAMVIVENSYAYIKQSVDPYLCSSAQPRKKTLELQPDSVIKPNTTTDEPAYFSKSKPIEKKFMPLWIWR